MDVYKNLLAASEEKLEFANKRMKIIIENGIQTATLLFTPDDH